MSHAHPSYPELTHSATKRLGEMRSGQPGTMQAFRTLSESAMSAGALTKKTKELIALALGIGARCDDCIGFHARALVALNATSAEIQETIGVAVYMGGGPSLMYGAHALAAFEQFSEKAGERAAV